MATPKWADRASLHNATLDAAGHHVEEGFGGGATYLLIEDIHSTPLVFDDILQTSEGDDFLYTVEEIE